MVFKLNISENGKAWKMELEGEFFIGKNVGDNIAGKGISEDLAGYELEITGATDIAGFPHTSELEGPELKRVLLTKGWGMKDNTKGIRKRKTVRGKQLSDKTVQINLKVIKAGNKSLKEIFPDQNKEPEAPAQEAPAETPKEAPKEETPEEETKPKAEEKKEEPAPAQ